MAVGAYRRQSRLFAAIRDEGEHFVVHFCSQLVSKKKSHHQASGLLALLDEVFCFAGLFSFRVFLFHFSPCFLSCSSIVDLCVCEFAQFDRLQSQECVVPNGSDASFVDKLTSKVRLVCIAFDRVVL